MPLQCCRTICQVSSKVDPFTVVDHYPILLDHRVGRVRLIFKLPPYYHIPDPLVLIQTFKGPTHNAPLKRVNMYRVERSRYTNEFDYHYEEEIIPLALIRRTCHLIPVFDNNNRPPIANTSSSPWDPLEQFERFYVNSYLDLHSFQLLC